MSEAAGRIGMTVDIDERLFKLAQNDRDGVQGRVELRHHRILIRGERDVGGMFRMMRSPTRVTEMPVPCS